MDSEQRKEEMRRLFIAAPPAMQEKILREMQKFLMKSGMVRNERTERAKVDSVIVDDLLPQESP